MNIDPDAAWKTIFTALQTAEKVSDGMCHVISVCAASYPHPDWPRFETIQYEADVAMLRNWIRETFQREPSSFPLHGLYFGLFNPVGNDGTSADIRVSGTGQYLRDAEWEWVAGDRWHYPKENSACSIALDAIYKLAYGGAKAGLRNDAEWPLALAYGALLVRALLSGQTTAILGDNVAATVGVVVGFDSGDCLRIGELTEDGFSFLPAPGL